MRTACAEVAARLDDGRLHLQHGPIDVLISIDADPSHRRLAERQARDAFTGMLQTLVDELPALRAPGSSVRGPVARRMQRASDVMAPFTDFVTPMAAVAGSVADELLAALVADRRIERAAVNNGGDIALHLAAGTSYRIGLIDESQGGRVCGHATLRADSASRGVATSGWRGRSHSLGIADAVTVLASSAAVADVAATLIANAIDIDAPGLVERRPAAELDAQSDLGDRAVTVGVGSLSSAHRMTALAGGADMARELLAAELIHGAWLYLQGEYRIVGADCIAGLDAPPALRQHRARTNSGCTI